MVRFQRLCLSLSERMSDIGGVTSCCEFASTKRSPASRWEFVRAESSALVSCVGVSEFIRQDAAERVA